MIYQTSLLNRSPSIKAPLNLLQRNICMNKKMSPLLTVLLVIFSLHGYTSDVATASDPDPLQDFCIPNIKWGYGRASAARLEAVPCKNSSEATTDDFVFSGLKKPADTFSNMGIAAVSVTPQIFPGLNTLGMSFVRADIKVGGINAPHFHPRATELTYVLQGKVYSGFVDSANRVFAKVIEEGEVMVFPRGLVHFQMNVGESPATVFGCFNSQNPGVQKIPSAIFGSEIKDELLEKAFGMNSKQIEKLRRKFAPKD